MILHFERIYSNCTWYLPSALSLLIWFETKQKERLNATMGCIEIKLLLICVGKFQGFHWTYFNLRIWNILLIFSEIISMSAKKSINWRMVMANSCKIYSSCAIQYLFSVEPQKYRDSWAVNQLHFKQRLK